MSNSNKSSQLRIVSDYLDFEENRPFGIYFYMNQKNIYKNYALIIGPKNTPYFGGFYLFQVEFPEDYPNKSPNLKLLTIDGRVRFNPNLYECGKVCLSILGTWSGPSWTNVMTIRTVLLSVQSLLNDFPIRNEPGLEEVKQDESKSILYNNFLNYHNINLAMINILKNILFIELNKYKCTKQKKSKSKKRNNQKDTEESKELDIDSIKEFNFIKIDEVEHFKDIILQSFKENYKEIDDLLKSLQIILGEIEFEKVIYFLPRKNHLDFVTLNENFEEIVSNLKKMNLY